MHGYAASARILRATPRVVDHAATDRTAEWRPGPAVAIVDDPTGRVEALAGATLAERWGRFHDRWLQLTFFLTDPESWR